MRRNILKRKALRVCVSLLLVTTLVLSSCTKSTTTAATATTAASTTVAVTTAATTTAATGISTTSTTTSTATTAQPTPQYGGSVTMVNDTGTNDPSNWDPDLTTSGSITTIYINPYLENFFCGDINKYGSAGTVKTYFNCRNIFLINT